MLKWSAKHVPSAQKEQDSHHYAVQRYLTTPSSNVNLAERMRPSLTHIALKAADPVMTVD